MLPTYWLIGKDPQYSIPDSESKLLLWSALVGLCTPCLKKLCNLFLSELRQISTNSDNFGRKMTERL